MGIKMAKTAQIWASQIHSSYQKRQISPMRGLEAGRATPRCTRLCPGKLAAVVRLVERTKSPHLNSIPSRKSEPPETDGNKNRRGGLNYTLSWHNEDAKNSRELDSIRFQAFFLIFLLPLRE
jgi:hypothetical protein